jgi:multiple sugar transport system permease protein
MLALSRREEDRMNKSKEKEVSYAKYGYMFIAPFFIAFLIFQFIPLIQTIYYSFFEYYRSGLKIVGPNPVGFENYKALFESDFLKYAGNTVLMWLLGFIPQIIVSLVLAAWFTDVRLKIKGKQFFKVVIYMPNLIMASAFAMLFFALFSDNGPVNNALVSAGILAEPFRFMSSVWGTRGLVGLMNFLMWFGNTTILLMAAVMGINPALFEAAELDGCSPRQTFFRITLPMIRPILVYVLITSMIGGLQMFDVPQILTNGKGTPDRSSMTLIMYLNNHLFSKNYGMAGAVSVILFIIAAILCLFVYFSLNADDDSKKIRKRDRFKPREEVLK